MSRLKKMASSETGFTVIELATVSVIMITLLSLSFFAVRQFWLSKGLEGAQDQVAEQMHAAQQRSFSESHPLVYGVWFLKGTTTWGLARYTTTTASCAVVHTYKFTDSVDVVATTDFTTAAGLTSTCQTATSGATAGNYEIAFFYPRGSATGGTVTLRQAGTGQTRNVTVTPLTGRVTRS